MNKKPELRDIPMGIQQKNIGKYVYRILWCNWHIIALKNHTRITFTEW